MQPAGRTGSHVTIRLPERLLERAGLGLLELTTDGALRRASPLGLAMLGLAAPTAFGMEPPALDQALVGCVREVVRRNGATAQAIVKGSSGRPLLATVWHAGGSRGKGRITCLLRQIPNDASRGSASREVELLEAMVEASQDGLTIVSETGQILRYNSRAVQLNGMQREATVGRTIEELVHAGYFDQSITREVLRRKADVTAVQTLRDGRRLLVSGRPVFAPDGGLKYVVLTDRDVTELSRLTADLQASTQLSERYRAELRHLELRELHHGDLVACSAPMQAARELALRCAAVGSPVLLLGETGTGKGVFAKLIHQASARSAGPFLEVNCGAIPEGLLEAELFGYVKGAFTGADPKGKPGLVELADGGTLFLNEVGDLPLAAQVKLLRFLEDGEIQPVGGTLRKRPDVRILAATNRPLPELMAQGRFRQDLYYRLNVLMIRLPPLRERREDIPWLVYMMLGRLGRPAKRLTPAALDALMRYPFPGNVRELWNLVERLVVLTDREEVAVEDLPAEVRPAAEGVPESVRPAQGGSWRLHERLGRVEAAILKEALEHWGSQARAARHLGVAQATVSRKIRQYGLK